MMGNEAQDAVEQLRAAGLKVTPQRVGLVQALAGDVTHPTAQELFQRLKPAFPGLAFATVYNTLAALMEARQVMPVRLGGATRFDPNTHPHDHSLCEACGAVRDVPVPGTDEPSQPLGSFQVRRVDRIYRGVCSGCQGA